MTKDEEKQLRHILKSVLVRAEAPAAETDSTMKMAQSVLDNCWRAGSRATSERMMSELKEELRGWTRHHLKNEGRIRTLEARVSVLKATIENLKQSDDPWPLPDVLEKLCDGVDHLLNDHDCDRDGHEADRHAVERGREFIEILRTLTVYASPSSSEPQSEAQEPQPLSADQSSQVSEPSVSQ